MPEYWRASHNKGSEDGRVASVLLTSVLGTAALGTILYVGHGWVQEYGWDGVLRYIWEGEAYPAQIQKLLDQLQEAESSRKKQEKIMHHMEEALDRARLDSVDGNQTTKNMVRGWVDNYKPHGNLEIALGNLNSALDNVAAKADSVIVSGSGINPESKVVQDIKRRKKVLSKQLVLDMERCDTFMACYKVLQE